MIALRIGGLQATVDKSRLDAVADLSGTGFISIRVYQETCSAVIV